MLDIILYAGDNSEVTDIAYSVFTGWTTWGSNSSRSNRSFSCPNCPDWMAVPSSLLLSEYWGLILRAKWQTSKHSSQCPFLRYPQSVLYL